MILLIIMSIGVAGKAQEKSVSKTETKTTRAVNLKTPKTIPPEMIKFFAGQWSGAGEFASGKKIEADVNFAPELDNQKLLYRHADRAPNRYKALGTWGFERDTEKFVMFVEDNFGGSRRFESDGWVDGKIIFLKDVPVSASNFPERFTFERQADNTFKMIYEAKRDGQNWKMGDYIIFNRVIKQFTINL